jgi:hypothetical protein
MEKIKFIQPNLKKNKNKNKNTNRVGVVGCLSFLSYIVTNVKLRTLACHIFAIYTSITSSDVCIYIYLHTFEMRGTSQCFNLKRSFLDERNKFFDEGPLNVSLFDCYI